MKRTYWIVRNDWTDSTKSLSVNRSNSIARFTSWIGVKKEEWHRLRKEGWRCEKVELKAVK